MSRIFINYRRQDSEGYVGRLYDHLTQHFSRDDLFMDVDSIQPGQDFVQMLEDAVNGCDVLLAVIGPQWAAISDEGGTRRLEQWNDFVRIELETALKGGKVIIPVLVGQARMPSPTDLPDTLKPLARRNALELSHQRFTHDIERLVTAIQNAAPPLANLAKPKSTSDTLEQKTALLKVVRDDVVNATTSPLYQLRIDNRYFPVLGEGSPDANIIFIGEAPGKTEAETGRPFCGPSGEVLDEMLRGINLRRQDVYLTNVVLDRPSTEKRSPTRSEIAFYTPFVDRMIDIIQPRVIVPLGGAATEYLLKRLDVPEQKQKIGELHGKLIKTKLHYGEIHVLPLYHPAVVLYSASQKDTLRKDFEKLKLFI